MHPIMCSDKRAPAICTHAVPVIATMTRSLNLAAALLLFSTHLHIGAGSATTQEEAGECSKRWPCPSNNFTDGGNYYSLKLSSAVYHPGQVIAVNVHMTSCPTLDSPGPKWYKLEAIFNMTSFPVGTFLEPYWRSEAHLCKNKNVVIFSTCESNPLDLPRLYSWTAPTTSMETVCFRLTVLTSGETSCSQVEACMEATPPDLTSGDHGSMVSGDDGYQEFGDDEDDFPADYQSHSDEDTHTSTADSMSSPSAATCWTYKELFIQYNISQWFPKCNCQGLYKPVQCKAFGQAECWCASSMRGSSIVGTRKPFLCTDPASLEFSSSCARYQY